MSATPADSARLALSWLTVAPVRGPEQVDRRVAGGAITVAPVVGLLLGAVTAGLLWVLGEAQAPALLAGLLAVGWLALATRGMHLDGLADTVDGLGCYGPPERALSVMRDGSTGPFAVVALVLVLGVQAVGLSTLAVEGRWWAVVLAVAAGRVAVGWACRRGVAAARPEGLGALVAGTQPVAVPLAWGAVLLVASAAAVDGRWWQGPVAVLVGVAVAAALSWHTTRRFGGVTGDVLGACSESVVTATVLVLALGA
ncbi:adenosylcobinamide-GDP ribazoletransferase [Rhodococcus sp. X156]|uniref:adenosylcobinamide-GDP ribazoletransferase n=1 Tax=Rhodococcus sp. X156 TaxID=2499145 RepID=UPI000FDAA1AC|nr:adenosylcobinamide-GDP ribazoletransferase [Rhodococcus sp. X156]